MVEINERIEALRNKRDSLRKEADDLLKAARRIDHQADMVCQRIEGMEEVLRAVAVQAMDVPSQANGEANPARRPRRDIKGMVQAALDGGAIRDIASLATQLECRPSQVADALKHISQT